MAWKPEISEREVEALRRARQKADLINWLRGEAAARGSTMEWYVAKTRWRADDVCAELLAAGIEAICPMERRWRRYPRSMKRFSVENPLLGNYLPVRLLKAESAWVGVLTFEGIECLMGSGETPVPLTDKEINAIQQLLDTSGHSAKADSRELQVGDRVLHPLGAFAELGGTVLEIDDDKREAVIATVLFGREIATRCGIDDLEKLS